jgi:hypothetical protein
MSARPASGKRWLAFARSVIDYYGGVCHICKHGGGRQVDHLEPVTERPDLIWSLPHARPAHGAPGNPCLQCSTICGRNIYCNQLRGAMSVERARRKIAEIATAHAAGKDTRAMVPQVRSRDMANQPAMPRPEPAADPGRPWLRPDRRPPQRGFRAIRHRRTLTLLAHPLLGRRRVHDDCHARAALDALAMRACLAHRPR